MKHRRLAALLLAGLSIASAARADDDRVLSLAGPWRFLRGGPTTATHPTTLPALAFDDSIDLPGTTDTRRKGTPSDDRSTEHLSQPYGFVGTCWYQRDVTVPASWRERRASLLLERTKYSQLWIDGQAVGDNAFVCTPQEYALGTLAPGRHTITLAVNNKRLPPSGADAHQYSGNTQGNWNGVIGRIELRATDAAWLDDVQAYPDAARRSVTVRVRLKNAAADARDGTLTLSATGDGVARDAAQTKSIALPAAGETTAEVTLPLGPDAALWDEFHPALHTLTVKLAGSKFADERTVTFGLRDFATRGTQFTTNGQPTFLRGKHDGCVFPLTGHPPMTVDGWLAYFKTCKDYGLNHVRFHTWTPPEAAFEAADQLGVYLQPELPFWGPFDQKVKDALKPEADRILAQYGNHPSFAMFSMGNEHWAGADVLASLVADLKAEDARHLYVRGTNAFSYTGRPGVGDEYLIGSDVKPIVNGPTFQVRGSNGGASNHGHVQAGPADTMATYADAIRGTTVPTVTHEMGQYVVFPDFKQVDKYTGVSRAFNLEAFRTRVTDAGLLDRADDFARASGALAALCYREEIESCLRTPAYGGFELLDLQDYPGQGSALVGMLDAFMDSKGIVTPARWRQFCAPQVLLARFPKYAWTTDETFAAMIDVAQYGANDLTGAAVKWTLRDADGKTLDSGALPAVDAKRGDVRTLGTLSIPLATVRPPVKITLDLQLAGTDVRTSYDLWVYPPSVAIAPPANVTIARTFDAAARQALADGKRVVLICDGAKPLARTTGGGFATDFWNFSFFHNRPATLGLLPDPKSAALAAFPTDAHTDWQWFDVALGSQPIVLDGLLPRGARMIVQTIDNYERNHTLGLIFEAKVGPGRLLVCASDLVDLAPQHPAARQLLSSLLAYAGSDRFDPSTSLGVEVLKPLLRTTIPLAGATVTASSFDKGWQGYAAAQAIDGNDDKGWQADAEARGDAWCEVTLAKPTDLHGIEIVWPAAKPGYAYVVETSADGATWQVAADERKNAFADARHTLPLEARGVTSVRITVSAMPDGRAAGINEMRFFAAE